MHIKLFAADKTDVGKQRDQNEDRPYRRVESAEDGDRGLFIVADGMGGYKAGEVASRMAVETINKAMDTFFKPIHDQPTIKIDRSMLRPSSPTGKPSKAETHKLSEATMASAVEDQLRAAIKQANQAIVRYGEQQSEARGLGSTVTTLLIQNDLAYIGNVGDSRTYLLRNGALTPLTKDHSLVAKLVETKQIKPEEVYTHPHRNLIYRSLGAGRSTLEVDIFHETVQAGDLFLLCSDGLWEMVHPEELERTMKMQASPQAICDKLIELANAGGGEDNITAVVVQVSAH
ncbi:hypothetical protein KSC_082700 [Ktedonobacter sp. SOSP1-52]|uniref:PP2C family protein-serine/threonine phosphatase n=1 Tax=Ktedonobacter sp. SOSP1-52 TaxID=2778366 RepID=UPI001914F6AA|nr:PP2C family serine/threonine-protein phosphatase [Ktedonobacter sp. SOSP1-52]GHO69378.1 hypothetical protein KSC_082700 [Ktedonobacter sp. SOSP1-52]